MAEVVGTNMDRYVTVMIPMSEIYCDGSFNCRGQVAMSEVMDLAADIKARGLSFPLHLQEHTLKPPFKYRIISGHRRFTAMKYNKAVEAPCVIRKDLLSEVEAREENLRENIQRADLTMLQEARAIGYFTGLGWSVNQIAKKLGKSNGWVEPRRRLLLLPTEVRDAADKGVVTQNHINQMWLHRDNREKLMEILRAIKTRSEAGERAIVVKEEMTIVEFAKIRRPKPSEVNEFMEVLAKNITNKIDEPEYFAHRVLAWVQGNISLAGLYASLRRECDKLEVPFTPPEDIRRLLMSVAKV